VRSTDPAAARARAAGAGRSYTGRPAGGTGVGSGRGGWGEEQLPFSDKIGFITEHKKGLISLCRKPPKLS
jgi:hypothetical protein